MRSSVEVAVSSLREALLFNLIGIFLAVATLLIYRIPVGDSFGFIILLESTGLMLIGGALGVAGQATTRKITEMLSRRKISTESPRITNVRAAVYSLTGAMLFAEGAVMAYLFG